MAALAQEYMFDIDCEDQLRDIDDGEQNLEDEANDMLRLWNRDDFMNEVSKEREKIKRDKDNDSIVYYDGDTEFKTIAADMQCLEGGQVYIKILEPNPSGKQIDGSKTILFERIGYLEFEPTPFESSIHDGKPTKLNLIEGPIIPGLLKALIHLREGECANVLIEPSMAFGPLGCLPIIPEEASLFYHIKIHKVWDESQLNGIIEYERSYMDQVPLEEKLAVVESHKQIANTYLRDGDYREALIRYKAAIKCLDEVSSEAAEKSNDVSKMLVTLLQNAAIGFNKLNMHKSATKTAKRALFIDPTNIKAYYQLAKARIGLSDYSGASKWIEKATEIWPNNNSFDHLKVELDFKYRDERKKRNEIMRNMARACQ